MLVFDFMTVESMNQQHTQGEKKWLHVSLCKLSVAAVGCLYVIQELP